MAKASKRAASHGGRGGRKTTQRPGRKATNLSLETEAIAKGEEYSRRHGTSLSQLVSDFLRSLPTGRGDMAKAELTPAVRRLYGIAAGAAVSRESHREHLLAKYGGGGRG